jgi:large conductance mechanosensitive channel
VFLNTMMDFVIVAVAIFLLVQFINRLSRQREATPTVPITREYPFCVSSIPLRATRCPQCTSTLQAA